MGRTSQSLKLSPNGQKQRIEASHLDRVDGRVHACLGCPLLPSTLHGWVEGTVRQFFPEIENVEAETN